MSTREVATQAADRPHPFDGSDNVCDTCLRGRDDELHVMWAEVASASRETAATNRSTMVRELGT
jgi:hypothetical protein